MTAIPSSRAKSVQIKVYSQLLESLYAATLDESQWQTFLTRLCEATHSIVALLIRNDDGMGRRLLASGGATPPPGEVGYSTADPVRAAFMQNPRTGIIEVEDFLPHSQLVRSDYYPVMAALGITYGTCIVPTLSMRRYDLISLWRGGDRPRLEPQLAELLALLYPHIQTALRIHQALGVSVQRARTAEAVLDASSTASMLLSVSGRLLYANHAARQLLSDGDGLIQRGGGVLPASVEQRSEFSHLIVAAASWDRPGSAMRVERANRRQPLQLSISPFHIEGSRRSRRVLVLATDPGNAPQIPDAVLRQLYGLTLAEAEVANGLLTGFPPEAIAAIRGVSLQTVRTQIKSLLSKTGTRRQTDLVRLLCSLPRAAE